MTDEDSQETVIRRRNSKQSQIWQDIHTTVDWAKIKTY